jgi:succinylglutamate desuccinylase
MVEVYSKALNKAIEVDRLIGKIENKSQGPTVVIFGGIHGNEPAGVFALKHIFEKYSEAEINGSIYGITGNLSALKKGQRFIHSDLNRIWTEDNLDGSKSKNAINPEEQEQAELFEILKKILKDDKSPFYFIDLHTTSSRSLPFITINDAMINRKFSQQFPVPIVLGIEEYLDGPLLSYVNTLGYVSLGFESGQHDDKEAITNSIAFLNLVLSATGSFKEVNLADHRKHFDQLNQFTSNHRDTFEVIYLYQIQNGEVFEMEPKFDSFQHIQKGTLLAQSNGTDVISEFSARIFMPLYQKRGREGFFIIKKINPFFMHLSAVLRRIRADNLLVIFPGVSWQNRKKGILQVNLKVARFMAKPLFHLLGYRNKQIDKTHLRLYNRDRVSKLKMYKELKWYRSRSRH